MKANAKTIQKIMSMLVGGAVALMGTGCSSDTPDEPGKDEAKLIVMNVSADLNSWVPGNSSRSQITDANITGQDFQFWVTTAAGDKRYEGFLDYVNSGWNLVSTLGGTPQNMYWAWDPWNFYALGHSVRSYQESGHLAVTKDITTADIKSTLQGDGFLAIPVETANRVCDNDLVFASAVGKTRDDNDGKVNLHMRHLLSRLTFSIGAKREGLKIKANKIAVDQLYGTGVCKVNLKKSSEKTNTSWSNTSDIVWDLSAGVRRDHDTGGIDVLETGYIDNNGQPGTKQVTKGGQLMDMFVIPQQVPYNTQQLCLAVHIEDAEGNVIWPKDGHADAYEWKRTSLPNTTWLPGVQYHFNILVDAEDVKVEIRPYAFSVNPFEDGGTIKPDMGE